MSNHEWHSVRYGHNDFIDVCKTCNVERFNGVSDQGCPDKLWDQYNIEGHDWVTFVAPTKVTKVYEYTSLPEDKENNLASGQAMLGFTLKFIRNDNVIFHKYYDRYRDLRKPISQKLGFYGNLINEKELKATLLSPISPKISEIRNKETPFLYFLESSSTNVKDYNMKYLGQDTYEFNVVMEM